MPGTHPTRATKPAAGSPTAPLGLGPPAEGEVLFMWRPGGQENKGAEKIEDRTAEPVVALQVLDRFVGEPVKVAAAKDGQAEDQRQNGACQPIIFSRPGF